MFEDTPGGGSWQIGGAPREKQIKKAIEARARTVYTTDMTEESNVLTLNPKVARAASEALNMFQRGEIAPGAERLGKAMSLSAKLPKGKSPMIYVVACLGVLNDLPEESRVPGRESSRLVMKHVGVCGILEEWAFSRPQGSQETSVNYHSACSRFCEDMPSDFRGPKDQIGIPAQILREFGEDVGTPEKAMAAIEKCLTMVGSLAAEPQSVAQESGASKTKVGQSPEQTQQGVQSPARGR